MQLYNKLLEDDLRHILRHTESLWKECKGKTIFITGGTGFFGKWFLETISFLNNEIDLGLHTIVLSRKPDKFINQYPYFKQPKIKFIQGDVRDFSFPKEDIHYIIHAGTAASDKLNAEQPLEMFDTIVNGTRRVLNLAKEKHVESFLFTSSGAVYGKQPSNITHIPESYMGAPDCVNLRSTYGEGKRAGEMLCSLYCNQYQVPVKIARCFAFVGPYLPLDIHFAIGNFIMNAIKGEDIIIKGDGTPYRSYLYAADLMIWLMSILLKGENNGPYNVGSNESLSLKEIAGMICRVQPEIGVIILTERQSNKPAERYVPSIDLMRESMDVNVNVDLYSAINKTLLFYKK